MLVYDFVFRLYFICCLVFIFHRVCRHVSHFGTRSLVEEVYRSQQIVPLEGLFYLCAFQRRWLFRAALFLNQ